MTDENNTIIVPIANLNYEEVMLIIDILKRRYPKPTPMIKEIVIKLEGKIQDYLEFLKIYHGENRGIMAVYECEDCGFKTDEIEFMKVHQNISEHKKLVEENNEI